MESWSGENMWIITEQHEVIMEVKIKYSEEGSVNYLDARPAKALRKKNVKIQVKGKQSKYPFVLGEHDVEKRA